MASPTQPSDNARILKIQNVAKTFGAIQALVRVTMEIRAGEVHALIGENGAGKSTLMKILSGAHPADHGEILLDSKPYSPSGTAEARQKGIAMIYQELSLAPHLTVEENITLGMEHTRAGFVTSRAPDVTRCLAMLGYPDLQPSTRTGLLSIGIQQVIEIARALASNARVIIMDEPTSSLSASDTQALFRTIRALRDQGIAIVYISHFLEEVRQIADVVTVLRDGESVLSSPISAISMNAMVEAMVGRTLETMFPRVPHSIGAPILEVQQLQGQPLPDKITFSLRKGEILGIAGLVGSGRSETIRSIFGLHPASDGLLQVQSIRQKARCMTVPRALSLGMDLLSENRKEEGLATTQSIRFNITLSSLHRFTRFGMISGKQEHAAATRQHIRLGIKARTPDTSVLHLSGGNQQKTAIARLLERDGEILFLDEPTRGVDVSSKAEICRLIGECAAQGKAIVMVSSYLPELFGICDTLAVMHRGRISQPRPVADWTQEEIMHYATSGE